MTARFTRLQLANWKNFQKVDIPLGRRVFVVGPNASGKTNLLDALWFLHDIAAPGGGLVNAVEGRRGLKHIRSLHATRNSWTTVAVEMEIGGDAEIWSYTLELSGNERKGPPLRVEKERVLHGGVEIVARSAEYERDEELLTETFLEQTSQNKSFRPLLSALRSVVHVHVDPQVVRVPARAEELSRQESPGSDFIGQLARKTKAQQDRELRRIEKLLQVAVPQFSELQLEFDRLGNPHLLLRYKHWRGQGSWQNEQEFSDGTLRLIGVLWAIGQGTAPLLLEEPELSLHREVIRQLPRLFVRAAHRSGRQVIVTTNAEEMLDDEGIDPSEVVLLQPTARQTAVLLGSEIPPFVGAAEAGVSLGQLVTGFTRPEGVEKLAFAALGHSSR
jgi:predicted ATPase